MPHSSDPFETREPCPRCGGEGRWHDVGCPNGRGPELTSKPTYRHEMDGRRTIRRDGVVLHGVALKDSRNGPFSLAFRPDGHGETFLIDTTKWRVAFEAPGYVARNPLAEEIARLVWARYRAQWDVFQNVAEQDNFTLTDRSRKAFARMDALAGLFSEAAALVLTATGHEEVNVEAMGARRDLEEAMSTERPRGPKSEGTE